MGRDEVIRFFQDRNDLRDKELRAVPDETPKLKPIWVQFAIGDHVLYKGHPSTGFSDVLGRVVGVRVHGEGGAIYRVRWSDTREASSHFGFELHGVDMEDAS